MFQPTDTAKDASVQVLAPSSLPSGEWDAFAAQARDEVDRPFSAKRIAALGALSGKVLNHSRLRRETAATALGFWLRPSSLARFESEFRAVAGGACRVPAGLVFHVTPANVDTMFVYSWALAFLTGNANIVRLSTRTSPLVSDLLQCLNEVFSAHCDACGGNAFISYGHNDAVTAALSSRCDLRVVWGGDETVARLRAVPLNPHAAERSFASKRALSVFSAPAYLGEVEAVRGELAARMAADILPFAQMACSSPHVVYWLGAQEPAREATEDFGRRLELAMSAKSEEADLGAAVRRLNFAFSAVAAGRCDAVLQQAHTTQLHATSAEHAETTEVCGAGLLTHTAVPDVRAVCTYLGRHHQTITYFGLNESERNDLAYLAGTRGVDRVVAAGKALNFGPYWDGYSLWDDFTRVVVIE